ncbi:MAG: VCBS repeat-containing protein, partial [Acidobacteriota bacterium]|nr:VCBS repeat-containing protein [Acidobacteriota bacterium]
MKLMKCGLTLLSILVILAAADLLNAQTFSNPVRIPTSQDPISVFAVDLNGDGLPDLLYETSSLNSTPGTMQTLLAQSSGGYAEGPATTLPLMVGACRPVDVNNDGRQDLVCINYIDACDSQIATLLSNGDGSFQPPIYSGLMQSNCLWTSFYPSLYTPADVSSDSIPDLTVGDAYNFEFFVLLGDGTGRFNVSFRAYPATVQYGGEILVTDLNGDGKADLFTDVGPYVWLGKGGGTFTDGGNYGNYDSCNLYDLEADGHPDAVCANMFTNSGLSYELDILHGNADGSFNTTPIASQPLQGGFAALESPTAILDINGDGIPDILGTSSDGLSVLQGQSSLKFAAPVHSAVGSFGPVGSTTSQIIDLNHDGYKDLVCTGTRGLYISYGTKSGTYDAPAAFPVAGTLGGMTVADFNGDGIPDIAATGDKSIELSLGDGHGAFQPPVALPNGGISFAASTFAFNIAHGDFRGNGRQDILAIGSSGTYEYDSYILFNNGDGTFQPPQELVNSKVTWPYFELFAIADFNLDGRDDFLTTSADFQTSYVGLSNGDGTFNMVTTALPFAGSSNPTFPALADFNKDGKLDLVYLAGANAYVLKGNGDGSFKTNALVLPIPPYQGQSLYYRPLAVTTGDFDGDGNPDFALLAEVGGYEVPPAPTVGPETAAYVFYGNGDGTFVSPVIAGGFDEFYDTVYSADLNKDGRSDLILQNTGALTTFPGNSVGVVTSVPGRLFGPESIYTTAGPIANGTFVTDVNRDGYPDLLISNSSYFESGYATAGGNAVTELLNLGPQTNPNLVASSTNLAASSQSFVAGTSVNFTATVSGGSSSGSTPSGSVRFADQTGVESTVPLVPSSNASATATFTTNMIGVGADTMSATYSGDSN